MRLTILAVFCCELLVSAWLHTASGGELGANKSDLLLQYLDPAPTHASRDAAGERLIRRAMAEKAVGDAHDAGLAFLRVGVTGLRPERTRQPQQRPGALAERPTGLLGGGRPDVRCARPV
jgi:hypothetical protein